MFAKKKLRDDYVCYSLEILDYSIGYSVRIGQEGDQDENFHFDFQVQLSESVNSVSKGSIIVYGTKDGGGGALHYDSDKNLHGCLWMGNAGAIALSGLLATGQTPRLVLWGNSFFRREARIRDISWYTAGHSELVE